MEEIWKDVPEYEGLYQVSNLGRVRSVPKCWINNGRLVCNKNYKLLSMDTFTGGYVRVGLNKNNKEKKIRVHQLVAMAFLGHKRCGHKIVIDHINDNKLDNRVENLQMVSHRYNVYKTQGKHTSNYKGVAFHKKSNKWQSMIYINKKNTFLGLFENEYNAHLAYQNALQNLEQ